MLSRLGLVALALSAATVFAQAPNPPVVHRPPQTKAEQQKQEPSADQSEPTFRVNVKLVNVFASVTDDKGAPYAGLTKDDFRLQEDGEEQKIAVFDRESGLPLSIVMAVDTSMSTHKDLALELNSARRFTHAILRPVDSISLYQFSTYVDELQPFTSDAQRFDHALARVRPGAATALYDAIYLAAQALNKRQGRKVMVLITDGGDTSSKTDYQEAVRAAQISEALIYSVIMVPIEADAGRDTGGEHALIQLSRDTGGKSYYASSLQQLDEAFRQISDELRTQYLIGYYPSRRVGAEFRQIHVEVTPEARRRAGKELIVRHRTGYYNSKLD